MHRVSAWLDERSAPFVATVLFAVAGLGYALLWASLAHRGWHSYSDLWNSAGLALSVGHGHWAAVYAPPSQLDAPPGFEFLLAPVMVVGHALGLATTKAEGSSYKAFGLILAPVATVMAASVLFALDAIARRWRFSEARRLALSMVAGLGVVSAAVFWGHPEDCIALAFVLWAALAVDRDGTTGLRRAGWLLGVAIACQPLALLAVAPVVARFGWRDVSGAAWRLALPTAVVILPELDRVAGEDTARRGRPALLPSGRVEHTVWPLRPRARQRDVQRRDTAARGHPRRRGDGLRPVPPPP